jgi:hypothetical protein
VNLGGSGADAADGANFEDESRWCFVDLPGALSSYSFDPKKVNVKITTSRGDQALRAVASSALCYLVAPVPAWHYDDPAAPKRIELCASACDMLRQDGGGAITVLFGCAPHCTAS